MIKVAALLVIGNFAVYPRGGVLGPAVLPVLLAGGAGSRLWPASDPWMPKPFLPLVNGESTFAATLERIADAALFLPAVVVAGCSIRHQVAAALEEAGVSATLLLESEALGTAAAIAAAAEWARAVHPEALLLVLATDHLIRDSISFRAAVTRACPVAAAGRIAIFGVPPRDAGAGYGYIRPGPPVTDAEGVFEVAAFHEKPDAAEARRLVAGGCLWNSGNLLAAPATIVAEVARHAPAIGRAAAAAVAAASRAGNVVDLAETPLDPRERLSFDHAVLERTGSAAVVGVSFDWADVGTWTSVWEASERDTRQNAIDGDVALLDTTGSLVRTDGPVVGVVGMADTVVVAANNAVLVAPRARAGEVRSLAPALAAIEARVLGGRARHYRPWGYFQSLDIGPSHQVKRIVLNPGGRLSLQKHSHRAEHWTVVGGVAEVTVGAEIRTLVENQSIFVPLGAVHRAANPGSVPATIIEVQYGDYLGEDDIIRLEDGPTSSG